MTDNAAPAPYAVSERLLVLMLGGIVVLTPFGIAMYLPAFPAMATEFGVSSSLIQNTLTLYIIGVAVGHLVYGPVADRFGRKPPLYFGISLYVLASAGCALTGDIDVLSVLRFLQGLGGSAGMALATAVVRDLFEYRAIARMLSRMSLVSGMGPILGPMIGSLIIAVAPWRAIFWLNVAMGVTALVAVRLWLPESLKPENARRHSVGAALATYLDVLRDRSFIGYALTGWLVMGSMFAYIAGSSFALISVFGVSPQLFSIIYAINAIGMVGSTQLNARLLRTRSPIDIMRSALILRTAVSVGVVLLDFFGLLRLPWYLPLLFIVVASMGLMTANSMAGAMQGQKQRAGSASALLGGMQFVLGTGAGLLLAALNDGTALAMNTVLALFTLAALLSFRVLVERNPRPAAESA